MQTNEAYIRPSHRAAGVSGNGFVYTQKDRNFYTLPCSSRNFGDGSTFSDSQINSMDGDDKEAAGEDWHAVYCREG